MTLTYPFGAGGGGRRQEGRGMEEGKRKSSLDGENLLYSHCLLTLESQALKAFVVYNNSNHK